MRRLRLRVKMVSSAMAPLLGGVPVHEDNIAGLPVVARQPLHAGEGGDGASSGGEENQRALDRVTYLGGILLPFSVVLGVLSMNEGFGPGRGLFWVFWVVAVPLAVVAILVIYADKLRLAEVWVAVPVDGEDFDGGVGSMFRLKELNGKMSVARVSRNAGGEAVIDFGGRTTRVLPIMYTSKTSNPWRTLTSPPRPAQMHSYVQDPNRPRAWQDHDNYKRRTSDNTSGAAFFPSPLQAR